MSGKKPDGNGPSTAQRAFDLWHARGCPTDSPEVDWYEAERQLAPGDLQSASLDAAVDESLTETFPASDPPASHQPDIPPSNAAQKWEATNSQGAERS